MRTLNIAVVSIGGAGRAHARRFEQNPKSRLRALFDIKQESAIGVGPLDKDVYFTNDFDRILNDKDIDVISICSPDHTHTDYAVRSLEAGKHVLVEKPMATSIEQCQEIEGAVKVSSGTFGVHHQMRYVPCYIKARNRVMGGTIGVICTAEALYVHDMRERAVRYDNWRVSMDEPQNTVLGASSHTIDLLRWVLNSEVSEVFSYANHLGWPEYPDIDTVTTLLKFKSGVIASVMSTISSNVRQINTLSLYGTRGVIVNNIYLDGSGPREIFHIPKEVPRRSRLLYKPLAILLRQVRSTQTYPFSSYEHEKACNALIDDYLNSIIIKKPFSIDFQEGAYTVQICLACIESYNKGKPVIIDRMF